MVTLANFPLISQQTKISADGSSPNAEMDCVPTSILAGLMYFHGVTQLSTEWNPDKLLDMAYPEGYKGGTSAQSFVNACATLGCKLYPINGTSSQLVAQIHAQLALNHPCIVTVPDIYVPASYGWTHVLCMYSESPGQLTALDPWPGKPVTKSDAEWASTLLDNQIWILESTHPQEGELPLLQLTDPMGQFFTQTDASHWHCKPTNVDLIYGHLAFYRQYQGIFGLPRTNEIYLAQLPGTAIMVYERAIAIYDPAHKYDSPPGSGAVYLMHTDNGGVGQQIIAKPLLAALQAQIDALNKQIIGLNAEIAGNPSATTVEELQTQVQQLRANIASYQEAVKQVDGIIHPLALV